MTLEDIHAARSKAIQKHDETLNRIASLRAKKKELAETLNKDIRDGKIADLQTLEDQIHLIDLQLPAMVNIVNTWKYDIDIEKATIAWNQHVKSYNTTFDKKMQDYAKARTQLAKQFIELVNMQKEMDTERQLVCETLGVDPIAFNPVTCIPESPDGPAPLYFSEPHTLSELRTIYHHSSKSVVDAALFFEYGDINQSFMDLCRALLCQNVSNVLT